MKIKTLREGNERLYTLLVDSEVRQERRVSDAVNKLTTLNVQSEERQDRRLGVIQVWCDTQALNKKDGKYLEKKIKEVNRKILDLSSITDQQLQVFKVEVDTEIHELAELIAHVKFGDDEGGEGAYEH
jgi:hypothetical protein